MSKPIIALTPRIAENDRHSWVQDTYLSCIIAAGGIPVIIPANVGAAIGPEDFSELVERFDGIVFTGGPDIHPGLFGEELLPECEELCPERDTLEIPLMLEAIKHNKPILGICRGLQIMNVALGGTLYQDIITQLPPTNVKHRQEEPYTQPIHKINIIKGTPLHNLLKSDQILVNSIHHQAIKKLAPDLYAMAKSDDGIIEAVYNIKKDFVMAFQWHPEWLGMNVPEAQKLFEAFINACEK